MTNDKSIENVLRYLRGWADANRDNENCYEQVITTDMHIRNIESGEYLVRITHPETGPCDDPTCVACAGRQSRMES